MISDSESVFSDDSLEGKNEVKYDLKLKTKNNNTGYRTKGTNLTIPFYQREVLVEDVKTDIEKARAKLSSHKSSKIAGPKQLHNFKTNLGTTKAKGNQISSRDTSQIQTQPQSTGRISRRNDLFDQNGNSLKVRHRSVSYLEQFRKKNYGNRSLDSSSFSTTGSKSSRERSMSFISSFSGRSRKSSSEYEFYDELMVSPRNENHTRFESLKSSSLMEKTLNSADTNSFIKQTKVKPTVVTRVEVVMPDQHKTELDKMKIIEKRELYASKVKLRNQIKINRQKERDRNEKFNESFPSNLSFKECFLQPKPINGHVNMSDGNTSCFHSPRISAKLTRQKKGSKPEGKFTQKTAGKITKTNQVNKVKENLEISILQERHKREKSLIESLKNLYLTT